MIYLLTILVWIAISIVYLAPGMIATRLKHRHDGTIWIVTVLLGWTMIGWIAMFIWAISASRKNV